MKQHERGHEMYRKKAECWQLDKLKQMEAAKLEDA